MDIGKLHVVVVHFPIALALCAVLANVLWLAIPKDIFKRSAIYCLVLAVVSSLAAVITGFVTARGQELTGDYVNIFAIHKYLAIASFIAAVLVAGIKLGRPRLEKWWLAAYWLLMLALAVSIALTGHYGGMLVHGKNFLSDLF